MFTLQYTVNVLIVGTSKLRTVLKVRTSEIVVGRLIELVDHYSLRAIRVDHR